MRTQPINTLFSDGDLDDALRAQNQGIPGLVDEVPEGQFLESTDEQLREHFYSKLWIKPLTLHEDRAEMRKEENQIDVSGDRNRSWSRDIAGPRMIPGTRVIITYPYTGDQSLWKLRPNPYTMNFPIGDITPHRGEQAGTLVITIARAHDVDQDQFRQERDAILSHVRNHIQNQHGQLERFNAELSKQIQAAIDARRERLKRHDGLSEILDIPLERRDGAPNIVPIRVEKKITQPLPPPPESGFNPEPGITDELYENILNILRHEGRSFETTPATFAKFDEEELRDIILAHLNGHYKGGATGETFRKLGKTDINIEDEDRAAFVGECKVWRGQKEIVEGVHQLFRYLTWRDCKASLIIFNKDVQGFTKLLKTVSEALSEHPLLVKDLGQQGDGEWRHIFCSQEDEDRHIVLHTFLFNLYAK